MGGVFFFFFKRIYIVFGVMGSNKGTKKDNERCRCAAGLCIIIIIIVIVILESFRK